jgi:hypothetical protein
VVSDLIYHSLEEGFVASRMTARSRSVTPALSSKVGVDFAASSREFPACEKAGNPAVCELDAIQKQAGSLRYYGRAASMSCLATDGMTSVSVELFFVNTTSTNSLPSGSLT